MNHISAFLIRALSEVGLQARFWSKMMVTVILHQIHLKKCGENVVSVAFSVSSISNFQIFGFPGSLQRPRTSCGPIFNPQKAFFSSKLTISKGFFLQQRKARGCLNPSKSHLQRKSVQM
jgi:hypothetical protein